MRKISIFQQYRVPVSQIVDEIMGRNELHYRPSPVGSLVHGGINPQCRLVSPHREIK